MSAIVTVKQMREIEDDSNAAGVSYDCLLQNAGLAIYNWIIANIRLLRSDLIIGLIGAGNNGGDALVALSHFSRQNYAALAIICQPGKNDTYLEMYRQNGGTVISLEEARQSPYVFRQARLILDGIFGIGFHPPLNPPIKSLFSEINRLHGKPEIIAIDCPSGVDCDTGSTDAGTLAASHTLTLGCAKTGLLTRQAHPYIGKLHVLEIGIPQKIMAHSFPFLFLTDAMMQCLPKRANISHKGSFGTAGIIGGCSKYPGAVHLAATAALSMGAGLVEIASTEEIRYITATTLPEAIWVDLEGSEGYISRFPDNFIKELRATALLIGPGMGFNQTTLAVFQKLMLMIKMLPDLPLVIDADALRLLSKIPNWWELLPDESVLTPHPGEMHCLTGLPVDEIEANRENITRQYAARWHKIVVLKGALTVISDGTTVWINPVASSALAKAGSGDVLGGIIVSLLAQKVKHIDAACLGVWLHGQAGLYLNWHKPAECITAGDIARAIECIIK